MWLIATTYFSEDHLMPFAHAQFLHLSYWSIDFLICLFWSVCCGLFWLKPWPAQYLEVCVPECVVCVCGWFLVSTNQATLRASHDYTGLCPSGSYVCPKLFISHSVLIWVNLTVVCQHYWLKSLPFFVINSLWCIIFCLMWRRAEWKWFVLMTWPKANFPKP